MAELLRLEGVSAGYGAARVLNGIDIALEAGHSLALLGRNGAGKTTLIQTILGLTTLHAGRVLFAGRDITRLAPQARAQAGIGWVPQERAIFPSLTVAENLSALARPGPWSAERVWQQFPRLRERRVNMGGQLSGGEQQMLAVGRALVLNPRLLLLDEPLEGLAPIIASELLAAIVQIVQGEGLSVIIVEQKARMILPITDMAVILERGSVAHLATSAALAGNGTVLDRYLGIARAAS